MLRELHLPLCVSDLMRSGGDAGVYSKTVAMTPASCVFLLIWREGNKCSDLVGLTSGSRYVPAVLMLSGSTFHTFKNNISTKYVAVRAMWIWSDHQEASAWWHQQTNIRNHLETNVHFSFQTKLCCFCDHQDFFLCLLLQKQVFFLSNLIFSKSFAPWALRTIITEEPKFKTEEI